MIAPDGAAGVGFVLSGTSVGRWSRAQAVALRSGRPVSRLTTIPPLETRAPVVLDQRRHVLLYVEAPVNQGSLAIGETRNIVGVGLRRGVVSVLFRVASRVPAARPMSLVLDPAGDDLLVLSQVEAEGVAASPAVYLDRLQLDALVHGKPAARWTDPYRLPPGACDELLGTYQPTGVVVDGSRLFTGCRPRAPARGLTFGVGSAGQHLGVLELSGVTTAPAPTVAAAFFPAPGVVDKVPETAADPVTGRLVMVTGGDGSYQMRVFDTAHQRYVGTLKGSGNSAGQTTDPRTGRLYFAGSNGGDLGRADLAALVPTQGQTQADPFTGLFRTGVGDHTRLTFDAATARLFIPLKDTTKSPTAFSILVVRDGLAPYVAPPAADPDAGALDTVDRPGLTDSTRSGSARAFGADYQLIGGLGNLYPNTTTSEPPPNVRSGSRSLRQAFIQRVGLGTDDAAALAVTGEEDSATDGDRQDAGAGSTFAPPASCSDFGSSPTKKPIVSLTAEVLCDAQQQRASATASYTSEGAVFVTGTGTSAPVAAPVQVGRSTASVTTQRLPNRGPLTTTATATAENVTILGVVRLGKVTSTVTVATNGRHGTNVVKGPRLTVTGVEVNGTDVCGDSCSVKQVADAVNTALSGHGRVSFPAAMVSRSPHGTTASVGQDPWYHAERVLDYDKADDDFVVPAMTIVMNLDGKAKSRLVVDLAGLAANGSYRIYALDKFTGGPPSAVGPGGSVLLPHVAAPAGAPQGTGGTSLPPSAAAASSPQQGIIGRIANGVRLSLRSPAAALPLLLIWALLGLPEYLAARRRLLLELPMLTREQDIA
jgi:hypothetical protein